jgi:flagellar biosynthesis/type III secretory pathway chaperone
MSYDVDPLSAFLRDLATNLPRQVPQDTRFSAEEMELIRSSGVSGVHLEAITEAKMILGARLQWITRSGPKGGV